jgi:formylglycine-generating enzyme required for sulfatase activity
MRFALLLSLLLAACHNKKSEPAPVSAADAGEPVADAGEPDSGQPVHSGPAPVPMIHFDAGKFMMGLESNVIGGDYRDMQPMHPAQVSGFWLDVYEVTVIAYRACVQAGACSVDGIETVTGDEYRRACNWNQPGYDNDPINCVTWDQANAYCRWVGKELPTEEMWEYAAAGPQRRDFPWGKSVPGRPWGMPDDADERVGCPYAVQRDHPERGDRSSRESTCPVGMRPKGDTPEGIKDMAANVSEWTSSFFCPYKSPKCTTKEHVIRGGTFNSHPFNYRTVVRMAGEPEFRADLVGFRCARPDPSSSPDTK